MINIPKQFSIGDDFALHVLPFSFAGSEYNSKGLTPMGVNLVVDIRGSDNSIRWQANRNDDGSWSFSVSGSVTEQYNSGLAYWNAYINDGFTKTTIDSGTITFLDDLAIADSNYDPRTLAERALADAEAALATFSKSGGKVKKYTIGLRNMEFSTIPEIIQAINYWKVRVANEATSKAALQAQKQSGIQSGSFGGLRDLKVRFL